jgi:hypothetical protein
MTKKPATVVTGAWRIIKYACISGGWVWVHRWLFDTDKAYKRSFKHHIGQALRLSEAWEDGQKHPWYPKDDDERYTVEAFDGIAWVQIEEWIGPNPEQRILRGLRP